MRRAYVPLALFAIFMLGLSASLLVYNASERVAQSNYDLLEHAFADLRTISEFRSDLNEHERLAYELYAVIDASQFRSRLIDQRQRIESSIPDLAAVGMPGPALEKLNSHWANITEEVGALIENIDADVTDWDAARAQLKTISEQRRLMDPFLNELVTVAQERANQAEMQSRDDLTLMSSLVLAYTGIILLVALTVGWMLRRLVMANESNRALAQFPERNPLPVFTITFDGRIQYTNQAANTFADRALDRGVPTEQLVPDEVMARFREALKHQTDGEVEGRIGDRQLAYQWYWLADQQIFHIYLQDVTKERQAELELKRLAFSDDVTGLLNRNALVLELEECLEKDGNVYLAFLSINRFGLLPSSVGFYSTDRLLNDFARELAACAGEWFGESVHTARLEGALFAICWTDKGSNRQSGFLIQSFLDSLPSVLRTDRIVFHAGYRLGLKVSSDQESIDADGMFRDADAAFRTAEQSTSRNFFVHDAEIRDEQQSILLIEEKLREAIDSGGRGLETYLQPKVALQSRRIVGAELLLRWEDPELGRISPGRFIPIAEQSGLIIELGQWVVSQALNMLSDWRLEPGLSDLHLAINTAPVELESADYARHILHGLRSRGIPPDRLEVEVTERVLADMAGISRMDPLGQLRRAGVAISLDDFGTGYSSLSYLSAMPISHVKIDKSFVDELPPGERRIILAEVIVNLADQLGFECIAEGVETLAQKEFLASIGCQFAQGYYFSRPVPRDEFEALAGAGKLDRCLPA